MKINWIRAAMTDDNLVAEFLLRLNRPDLRRARSAVPLPPLDWGIRQPRSKAAASSVKKENESSWRRSPTTPLSWTASGAASPRDSSEESSRLLVLAARFKGSATTDTTNSVSANKRSRRKRTFAELKEEESSLLKEREHLNKQMESLRMKLEEQRLLNESLKRVKIDLHAQPATANEQIGPNSNNSLPERKVSTSEAPSNVSKKVKSEEISALDGDFRRVLNGPSIEKRHIFVLPDLNMTPESILEMS